MRADVGPQNGVCFEAFTFMCFWSHVQVYHSLFWPLEFTVPGRDNNKCYAKIICNKLDNVRSEQLKCNRQMCLNLWQPPAWAPDLFIFLCHTAGSSHRFPLPRTKCRRGDAGLRCSHEVWRHQRTVGHHHWHPPNLCWGKKTMLLLYLLGYLPVLVDCLRSCVYVFRMGFVFFGGGRHVASIRESVQTGPSVKVIATLPGWQVAWTPNWIWEQGDTGFLNWYHKYIY